MNNEIKASEGSKEALTSKKIKIPKGSKGAVASIGSNWGSAQVYFNTQVKIG